MPRAVDTAPHCGARCRPPGPPGSVPVWRLGSPTPAGTARQVGFDLDADRILEEMTDDLLYHGDLNAALRRMLQSGFRDRNGERIQGMRDMLEKLRRKRKDALEQYDLGGRLRRHRPGAARHRRHRARGPRRAGQGGPGERRPAPPGGHPGRRRRAPDAARHAAARPGRHGQGPPGVRLHLERGPRALRAADGPAAPAAHAALRQPDGGGHAGRVPRADAAHEGHDVGASTTCSSRRSGARTRSRRSRSSCSVTATSSPRTRRRSTSCSR